MIRKPAPNHLEARWIVLVNLHSAGGRYQRKWPELRLRLEELLPYAQIRVTENTQEVGEFLTSALVQGIRHVLAVGGDGTAHQVVNAVMRQKIAASTEITFALYPIGTGNDWVKTHQIPIRWGLWAAYFRQAQPKLQSLGVAEYQKEGVTTSSYFLNVAGLAYDAFVVKALEKEQTNLPAKLYYFWSVLKCLFKYTPQRARLRYNDQEVEQDFYTINLGVARYSGGGMQFVPHADPFSSDLALTYVRGVSKWEVILNTYRFYGGRIATYPHATLANTATVWIDPLEELDPFLLEADGELLGQCPARISVVPGALRFLGVKR